MKKVAITGGPAVTIGRLNGSGPRGATWLPDDTIVFATLGAPTDGLQGISANGGDATVLTHPEKWLLRLDSCQAASAASGDA